MLRFEPEYQGRASSLRLLVVMVWAAVVLMNRSGSIRIVVAVNDAGRAIGEDHVNARYLDTDVENVRRLRRQGYTYRQISLMMDMPIRTLRDYISGRRRCQSVAGWKTVVRKE